MVTDHCFDLGWLWLMGIDTTCIEVALGAGDEEGAGHVNAIEAEKIEIAAIDDVIGPGVRVQVHRGC